MPPRTGRRASILDVARTAGVAVGTVSNVLNRPEVVSPHLRERVQAAIDELGFVPNKVARQLRSGTVPTVGAVLLDIRNPFFTDVARGIEDRLTESDYTLMLASSDDDPAREAKYLNLFEQHGATGLLVVPTGPDLSALVAAQGRGVRVVVVDSSTTHDDLSSVGVDDVAGGALAVGHLLDAGHREILFLNGPHSIHQCAQRMAGARTAALHRGLDPDAVVREVPLGRLDASGGDAAVEGLLARGARPTALFCVNDLVAIGAQRALRRRGGWALLRDVAIVGYDDIDVAAELAQPLTSVRQPTHEVGHRAADLLLREAGAPVEHVIFQPELVVRESSPAGPQAPRSLA